MGTSNAIAMPRPRANADRKSPPYVLRAHAETAESRDSLRPKFAAGSTVNRTGRRRRAWSPTAVGLAVASDGRRLQRSRPGRSTPRLAALRVRPASRALRKMLPLSA